LLSKDGPIIKLLQENRRKLKIKNHVSAVPSSRKLYRIMEKFRTASLVLDKKTILQRFVVIETLK
jgi:hypothetical protein